MQKHIALFTAAAISALPAGALAAENLSTRDMMNEVTDACQGYADSTAAAKACLRSTLNEVVILRDHVADMLDERQHFIRGVARGQLLAACDITPSAEVRGNLQDVWTAGLDKGADCMNAILTISNAQDLPLDLRYFNTLANHINCLAYPEDPQTCLTPQRVLDFA